jgi:formylglycine-generating enzyme required for sulfatase activity
MNTALRNNLTTSRVAPVAAAVLVVAFWIAVPQGARQALDCDKPLSDPDIQELVAAGVPDARIRQFITSCGISLSLPDGVSVEGRLRALGASASVLTALAPPPSSPPGGKWRSPIDQREMVFIPSGRFQMGSPSTEDGRDVDESQTDIQIARGFWIDATEVSNEAFRKFVLARPDWQKGKLSPELHDGNYLKHWDGNTYPAGAGDAPVVWVNWFAARAYASWAGRRLPTEAEWEYAARAGSSSTYWWGDAFDAAHVSSKGHSVIADARRANRWGVQDALGSVWEWTSSLLKPYPYTPNDGREAIDAYGARVIRGGSFANGGVFLRAANRNTQQTSVANDLTGFRSAR